MTTKEVVTASGRAVFTGEPAKAVWFAIGCAARDIPCDLVRFDDTRLSVVVEKHLSVVRAKRIPLPVSWMDTVELRKLFLNGVGCTLQDLVSMTPLGATDFTSQKSSRQQSLALRVLAIVRRAEWRSKGTWSIQQHEDAQDSASARTQATGS